MTKSAEQKPPRSRETAEEARGYTLHDTGPEEVAETIEPFFTTYGRQIKIVLGQMRT